MARLEQADADVRSPRRQTEFPRLPRFQSCRTECDRLFDSQQAVELPHLGAPRRLQLGSDRRRHATAPWRHRRLPGACTVRLDLECLRQHRHRHLVTGLHRTDVHAAGVQPRSERAAAQPRLGRRSVDRHDRPRLPLPARPALHSRLRPRAVLGRSRDRRGALVEDAGRHLLLQRQQGSKRHEPGGRPSDVQAGEHRHRRRHPAVEHAEGKRAHRDAAAEPELPQFHSGRVLRAPERAVGRSRTVEHCLLELAVQPAHPRRHLRPGTVDLVVRDQEPLQHRGDVQLHHRSVQPRVRPLLRRTGRPAVVAPRGRRSEQGRHVEQRPVVRPGPEHGADPLPVEREDADRVRTVRRGRDAARFLPVLQLPQLHRSEHEQQSDPQAQ